MHECVSMRQGGRGREGLWERPFASQGALIAHLPAVCSPPVGPVSIWQVTQA